MQGFHTWSVCASVVTLRAGCRTRCWRAAEKRPRPECLTEVPPSNPVITGAGARTGEGRGRRGGGPGSRVIRVCWQAPLAKEGRAGGAPPERAPCARTEGRMGRGTRACPWRLPSLVQTDRSPGPGGVWLRVLIGTWAQSVTPRRRRSWASRCFVVLLVRPKTEPNGPAVSKL